MEADPKEKKDKKDKKDKKEKKEKKEKKVTNDEAPEDKKVVEETKLPEEKKDKKDKKDKKEKKEKKKEAKVAATQVAEVPNVAENVAEDTKEKKEKKDKKDKKEKKDKKRKGIEEVEVPLTEPPSAAPLTDLVDETLQETAMNDFFDDIDQDMDTAPGPEPEGDQFADQPPVEPNVLGEFLADVGDEEDEHTIVASEAPYTMGNYLRIVPPFEEKRIRKKPKIAPVPLPAPEEFEAGPDSQQEGLPQDLGISATFAGVMESLKIKRALQITERDASSFIEEFVQEMIEAAEKDLRQFEANPLETQVHKMNMLSKAVSVMEKFVFAELFVTYGGCRALGLWLRTLPNGELPNAHLRTTLLTCMLRLPISKEALQNCKDPPLGQIVSKLKNNPRETVPNRKAAALLVNKWVKQVLILPPDMSSFDETSEGPRALLPRKPTETLESFLEAEEESFKRIHPTIPVREGKDYQIHPPSTAMGMKRDKYHQDSNRYKLNEVLKDFNRPNKKAWRPYEVSIAGRQLNQL